MLGGGVVDVTWRCHRCHVEVSSDVTWCPMVSRGGIRQLTAQQTDGV